MATKAKKLGKSRAQKRAKKTRRKLKEAALNVFSEKTVDAATVEEITEKADLGKGTLYQHFNDKEDIIVTLVDEAVDHLIEHLRGYDCPPENLEDMLEHLLNAHYGFSVDCREEFLLLFQGRPFIRPQFDSSHASEEPYLRYLGEIEGQVWPYLSPRTDTMKVRCLACAVAGFVFGFFSFAMIGMTADETESSIKPLRRTFVRSLSTLLGR